MYKIRILVSPSLEVLRPPMAGWPPMWDSRRGFLKRRPCGYQASYLLSSVTFGSVRSGNLQAAHLVALK